MSACIDTSAAELAADLRAARRRAQDLQRERDELQRQLAALRPSLEAAQAQIAQLTRDRDEAMRYAALSRAATEAHQAVTASSLPERIQLPALVEALRTWKPGRLLTLELGPWLQSLTIKELPPGPFRKVAAEAAELLPRLGRVPLLILIHEGTKTQPVMLSFAQGTAEEIRAQLEEVMPGTAKALLNGGELTHKRHSRAFAVHGSVEATEGERVTCSAGEGVTLTLTRDCFPHDQVDAGLVFTMTVIIEAQQEGGVGG